MKYTFLLLFLLNLSVAHASENLPANPWASGKAVMSASEKYQSDYYTDFKNKLADIFSRKKEPENQIIISIKPIQYNTTQSKTEAPEKTKETEQDASCQNNTPLLSMFDNLRAVGYNIPKSESSEMNFTRFLPDKVSLPNNSSYITHIRKTVQEFERSSGFNIHDTLQKIMQ